MSAPDEAWPMIEEAVFRIFDESAARNPGEHIAIGTSLDELGWSDIEAEYPIAACQLLFRAQGRSLAHTGCLDAVMLDELAPLLEEPVGRILLPTVADGFVPGSTPERACGILLGSLPSEGRLVVPVTGPKGSVSIAVIDADRLHGERMDTFDPSAYWTKVSGPMSGELREASAEWNRAIAAAHRALATELVALADEALRIAVEQVTGRHQFGSAIGSFQSPRHQLADAKAQLEGARALLGETWRYGGRLSALTAKAAAGRAHRTVSDAAIQVCGAIGLTIEHDLHRYVMRGLQIDSLCGSYEQLEASLTSQLLDDHRPGRALPALVAWAD